MLDMKSTIYHAPAGQGWKHYPLDHDPSVLIAVVACHCVLSSSQSCLVECVTSGHAVTQPRPSQTVSYPHTKLRTGHREHNTISNDNDQNDKNDVQQLVYLRIPQMRLRNRLIAYRRWYTRSRLSEQALGSLGFPQRRTSGLCPLHHPQKCPVRYDSVQESEIELPGHIEASAPPYMTPPKAWKTRHGNYL